jgi:hypothetical protein
MFAFAQWTDTRMLALVAAAYSYQSTLDHDELILIGDFGGGTEIRKRMPMSCSFRSHPLPIKPSS